MVRGHLPHKSWRLSSLYQRYQSAKFDYKQDTTFSSLKVGPYDRIKTKASLAYSG